MQLRVLLSCLLLCLSCSSLADNPKVALQTNLGTIELELFEKTAPLSVANFLHYVKKGFYNGTIFHRTIPNFMIQGGGYSADLERKPTEAPIKNESKEASGNLRGTIAMARTAVPDSATSQFFINVADNKYLDYRPGRPGYAVFGKVVSGMDIVDEIARTATSEDGPFANLPDETITVISARLVPQRISSQQE